MGNANGPTYNPAMRISTDWRAVLAAAACGVAVAFNVGKVPIAMTELRAEFGLSLVAAGWMSSMINTLAVCTGLAFGILGDRVGALRTCYAGLAVSILGGVLGLVAASEGVLLISRFLEGAGQVAIVVSAPALLTSAAAPTDQRFALGIWSSYLPAGVGIIMLLAPLILPFGGWRGLWLLSLAALAMSALAVRRSEASYAPRAATPTDHSSWRNAREALAQPAPWLLAFAMMSWTLQHYALIIWLPTFLKEQRDLGMLATSLLSCIMVLANVPGNLIGGSLLQRGWHRGNLIAAASLVTGLAGAGIFLDGPARCAALSAVRAAVLRRRPDPGLGALRLGPSGQDAEADRHPAGPVHADGQRRPLHRPAHHRRHRRRQRPVARRAVGHGYGGGLRHPSRVGAAAVLAAAPGLTQVAPTGGQVPVLAPLATPAYNV
jgi:CP family cyanate transporter-like MFS transporter